MNILLTSFYYKPHIGGVENSLFYLGKSYQKLGYNVVIVASDSDLGKKGRLPQHEILDGLNIIRVKRFLPRFAIFFFLAPILNLAKFIFVFKKLSKQKKFALAIARSHLPVLALRIGRICPVKYIVPGLVKTQGMADFSFSNQGSLKQKILGWYIKYFIVRQNNFLQKLALKKANGVFVFSENMKRQVQSLFKGNFLIQRVYPGVDTNKFTQSNNLNFKESLGLKKEDFLFLCLGRVISAKGFDLAIKAMAKTQSKNAKLMIVGNGPEIVQLKKLSADLNISDKTLFFPETKEPESFFAIADVFLMTSLHETFGQTIIESMAAGLPIIAFDSHEPEVLTASSEIIENGINGYLCKFGVEPLVEAMKAIMELQDRKRISENNTKKVKEKYSWDILAKQLTDGAE